MIPEPFVLRRDRFPGIGAYIDACYLIVTKPTDIREVIRQVAQYRLAHLIYVIKVEGGGNIYRLRQTYIDIFAHAQKKYISRILIVENQVELSPRLREDVTQRDIALFLNAANPDVIVLGCLIEGVNGCLGKFMRLEKKQGNFAAIYSPKIVAMLLRYLRENEASIDTACNLVLSIWTYYVPLAYQQMEHGQSLFRDTLGNNLVQKFASDLANGLNSFRGVQAEGERMKKAFDWNYALQGTNCISMSNLLTGLSASVGELG